MRRIAELPATGPTSRRMRPESVSRGGARYSRQDNDSALGPENRTECFGVFAGICAAVNDSSRCGFANSSARKPNVKLSLAGIYDLFGNSDFPAARRLPI